MGSISDAFATAFRNWLVNSVPASGAYEPSKESIRQIGPLIESAIATSALGSVGTAKSTKELLDEDLAHDAGTTGLVYADSSDANNDLYVKTGASGSGGWTNTGAIHSVLGTLVLPYVAGISAVDTATFVTPLTIGECTGTGAGASGPSSTYSVGPHFQQRAKLVGGRINVTVSGSVTIKRALRLGDSGKHEANSDELTFSPSASGIFEFDEADILDAHGGVPFVFEAGELVAFEGSAGIRVTSSIEPYFSWATSLTTSPTATSLNIASSGATWDAEFYFRLAAPESDPAMTVLEQIDTFTALPPGWINGASATFSDGAVVLANPGFINQLSSGKPYGLDRRLIRCDVQFSTSNAHFQFQTNPAYPIDSDQMEGSLFAVNASTDDVWFYHRQDGSGSVPGIDEADKVPLTSLAGGAFSLETDHTYTLEIEKLDRDYSLTLIDPTGSALFTHVITNSPNTFTAALGYQTKYGMMHGAPGVAVTQGSAKLLNWQHIARYRTHCAVAIFGNSLTEGFSVTTAQKFGSLLAAQLGEDQVAISGVGGADTRGLINRAFVELDGLRPKVVIFEAGANPGDGADFSENLLILRRIARNAGAEVMFATPTGDAGRAAAVQALDGVTVLNFGAAVTSAGPGSSVVEGYFSGTRPDDDEPFMDSTHWNADGHQRQLGQLALDARAIVAVAAQQ